MPTMATTGDLAASSTDDRDRSLHTGTQVSTTISDFTEAVQDAVASLLGAGSNITLYYDDAADTLTVTASGTGGGLDAEAVRDAIGVALIGVGNIAVVVNDAADTITISTTATVNSTDAALRDRSTHTGVQAIATVTGLQAALDALQPLDSDLTAIAALSTTAYGRAFLVLADAAAARTALALGTAALSASTDFQPIDSDLTAIAALATTTYGRALLTQADAAATKTVLALVKGDVGLGNVDNTADSAKPVSTAQAAADAAVQAYAIQRGNHTGTQTSTTISDFTEAVQDAVAALLGAGSNVTLFYDDAANTLTVTAAGSITDPEVVRDTIGIALVGTGVVTVTANDALDTITVSSVATQNSTDAALRDRSTHTGTQTADTLTDGVTNKAFLATERTKLTGVSTGATANSTDAALRDRSTHTGTQTADTLTDGVTNKAFLATERTKLAGVATGATANSTDAALRDRSTHTGTQDLDTTTDSATRLAMTAAERTKVAGVIAALAATLSNATGAGETVVAQWSLPAGLLTAGMMLDLQLLGQVSGTATLTFRVRIGTAGTTADALAATFTTSAAGVANQHVAGDILVACLTAGAGGTATAGGQVQFGGAVLTAATAVFAAASVDTTAALKISVTLQQSTGQTFTSRAAGLSRAG